MHKYLYFISGIPLYWILSPFIAIGAIFIGLPLTKTLAQTDLIQIPLFKFIPTFISDVVAVYIVALSFLFILYKTSKTSFIEYNKFAFYGCLIGCILNIGFSSQSVLGAGLIILPIVFFQLFGIFLAFKSANYIVKN
tara:strand:+ start:358 stop:768 length:411 start_codon:yes stop_codon:yes gene_type:complete